ncbi:MAG: hypothetical protein NZ805_10570 [Armatimonadetes bacterium]|nr:hypothetical protein [Armatimonadota bacterium]MDW8026888.1 hypothetical protein [Armatimonadota bacterium]
MLQDILDGKVIIHVPDRWLDEVCVGLVKAVHAKSLTLDEARDALKRVFRMISLSNWHIHFSDLHLVSRRVCRVGDGNQRQFLRRHLLVRRRKHRQNVLDY